MAQKAAKSLAVRNTSRLNTTHLITVAIHILFLLLRSTLRRSLLLTRYTLLSLPALITEFYLDRLARPTYTTSSDGTQSLQRAGDDLDAKGLTEFMWDIIYWTWINLILVILFGNWMWWAYLVVPGYGIYATVTTAAGVKGMLSGMGGPAGEGGPETQSNRQKKMEARGGGGGGGGGAGGGQKQKVKYQR